ncbi:MAG TPA: class I SAM-dependent methyltransferase [Methylomirabilota bacterium]|nr:class I SAM-dependent methyltransferase [Methylomirabilota bacterium]
MTCPLCAHRAAAEIAAATDGRLLRCGACALAYSHPPRRTERVREEYEVVYAEPGAAARTAERRRHVFAEFFEHVRPEGDARLLDIGCGTGEFVLQACAHGWLATGLDLSPRAAALARARGADARTDWEGLPAGGFQAITLWNVVEFLERPLDTLGDVQRLLAPGGRVFVRTPNERFQLAVYRWRGRVAWCRPLARALGDAYYFHPLLWGPATLAGLLARAGFTGVRLWNSRPTAGDPYHARSPQREAAIHVAKRLVHAWARGAGALTRGRVLVGSSLSALGRKPG